MHTNYKLHEMKKTKTRLNGTQNLLTVTCSVHIPKLKKIKIYTKSKYHYDKTFSGGLRG